jgi:hypothetical protein
MWSLRQATARRGIWLMDRGGDRPELLKAMLRIQPRWILRVRQDRKLIGPQDQLASAGDWATWALQNRPVRGNAVTVPVRLPESVVGLPGSQVPLHLVVPIYQFSRDGLPDRWLLLTCGLIGHGTGPRQVRHGYALRWRAEDAKRYLGQIWHVERFLTRSMLALERMLAAACLAGGFLARLQQDQPELCQYLQEQVLYHDATCTVPCYRLARGIQALAVRHHQMPMLQNA